MVKFLHEIISERINVHFDYTIFAINTIDFYKIKKPPKNRGFDIV